MVMEQQVRPLLHSRAAHKNEKKKKNLQAARLLYVCVEEQNISCICREDDHHHHDSSINCTSNLMQSAQLFCSHVEWICFKMHVAAQGTAEKWSLEGSIFFLSISKIPLL